MVKLVKKELVKEAKQVGKLYHSCSLDSVYKYIIKKDILSGSGYYTNYLLNTDDVVSFTRNKMYLVTSENTRDDVILFSFTVDGDKLSEKYKIIPYNDLVFYDGDYSDSFYDYTGLTESEEAVKGKIKDFSKYVLEVRYALNCDNLFYERSYDFNDTIIENRKNEFKRLYRMLKSCSSYLSKFQFSYGFDLSFNLNKENVYYLTTFPNTLNDLLEFISALKRLYEKKQLTSSTKKVLSRYLTDNAKALLLKPFLTWDMLEPIISKEIFRNDYIEDRLRLTGDFHYYDYSPEAIIALLSKFGGLDTDLLKNATHDELQDILKETLKKDGKHIASKEFDAIDDPNIYTHGVSKHSGKDLYDCLISNNKTYITKKELNKLIASII